MECEKVKPKVKITIDYDLHLVFVHSFFVYLLHIFLLQDKQI